MSRKEAEEHFDRGIHFFRGGFFPSALQEFRMVEKIDPDYPNIQYLIAATRKKAEEVTGKLLATIEESFSREIIELSNSLEIEGSTDLAPKIEFLLRNGRYQEALDKLSQVGNFVPDAKAYLLLTAKVFRRLGRFKEAENTLRRASVLYPKDPEIMNNLGNIYLAQNHFREARESFNAALELAPDNLVFRNNIGALEMQTYQLDSARRTFEDILKVRPGWSVVKRNLDHLKLRIEKLDEEIERFQKEYLEHPNYYDIGIALGKALLFRGKIDESRRILEKVVEKRPNLTAAYFFLGTLHELNQDWEKAIQNFREIVIHKKMSNSNDFTAFEKLYREGYLEEALEELKKIAVLDLDLASSNINLGIRYFEEGAWKKALAYFEEAVLLNSTYPDAFYWKAMAKIQLKKKTEAIKDLLEAVELNPRYGEAHFQLGMLLKKRSPKKAAIHFRSALENGVRKQFAEVAREFLGEGK